MKLSLCLAAILILAPAALAQDRQVTQLEPASTKVREMMFPMPSPTLAARPTGTVTHIKRPTSRLVKVVAIAAVVGLGAYAIHKSTNKAQATAWQVPIVPTTPAVVTPPTTCTPTQGTAPGIGVGVGTGTCP